MVHKEKFHKKEKSCKKGLLLKIIGRRKKTYSERLHCVACRVLREANTKFTISCASRGVSVFFLVLIDEPVSGLGGWRMN
jgi:hypothetical protein